MTTEAPSSTPSSPPDWEADVMLNDGSIATLRPIAAQDRHALAQFYSRVSDRSKYLRFFGTHPQLTEEDYARWMATRGYDKVTLVVVERGDIVAVAGYEIVEQMLPARVGDVSFLVQDSHHGKGVGNILLEHLAEIGREGAVERFVAEMLTENRQMVQVFIRAGYSAAPQLADGFIGVDFTIEPNESSREVMQRREQRAEASSIRRLLRPEAIAIVGDTPLTGGNIPAVRVPTIAQLQQLSQSVDVVFAPFDGTDPRELMAASAAAGAKGVVIMARSQNPGVPAAQLAAAVMAARDVGLRALGPAAVGIINTAAGLNGTPAPTPRPGRTGLFTQSAGVATLALSHALERGCGISNFIASGSFADVTANDVIQYWSTDEDTDVCLLSLDTIGNPRKFFRVLRRLALEKHVVVFLPSRALRSARHYAVDYDIEGLAASSPTALDDVIRTTGSMVVTRRDAMFDIAQLLARQPLPRGRRVAVLSNSAGLSEQMAAAADRFGLRPQALTVLEAPVGGIVQHARAARDSGTVDAVVVAVVDISDGIITAVHQQLQELAAEDSSVAVMASYVGFNLPDLRAGTGAEGQGQLPVFATYADALETMATVVANEKRRALARPTPEDEIGHGDLAAARAVVSQVLQDSPTGRWASDAECAEILAAYGIDIVPWRTTTTLEQAVSAAADLGWNVVLKCTSPMVRGRSELPTVLRHIHSAADMEQAWNTLVRLTEELHLGSDPAVLEPAVQREVQAGASLTLRAVEDPVIGPMISAGVSGIATDLLGDIAWRVPPLRRTDALTMLSELRASALLGGYRGTKATNLGPVEEVLMALGRLSDDIAAIVDVELTPVIVGMESTHIVGARMRIAPLDEHRDPLARALEDRS